MGNDLEKLTEGDIDSILGIALRLQGEGEMDSLNTKPVTYDKAFLERTAEESGIPIEYLGRAADIYMESISPKPTTNHSIDEVVNEGIFLMAQFPPNNPEVGVGLDIDESNHLRWYYLAAAEKDIPKKYVNAALKSLEFCDEVEKLYSKSDDYVLKGGVTILTSAIFSMVSYLEQSILNNPPNSIPMFAAFGAIIGLYYSYYLPSKIRQKSKDVEIEKQKELTRLLS